MKQLISHKEIEAIAKRMGEEISMHLKNEKRPPALICVMKGGMNFMVDLMHQIPCEALVDYIQVTTFSGTESLGRLKLVQDSTIDVKDRVVILVDDVVDSGLSCSYLKEHFVQKGAKEVLVACLIDKLAERKVPVTVDFAGMKLKEKAFLVGYGLDYFDMLRNLPDVYIAEARDVAHWDEILRK